MTNRGNEYAFPHGNFDGIKGMTIREKIAAQAMQSLINVSEYANKERHLETPSLHVYEKVAKYSVRFADTLIAELSKPTEK